MKRAACVLAFIATPFIAGFWALLCFYQGWVGGWQMVADEWPE